MLFEAVFVPYDIITDLINLTGGFSLPFFVPSCDPIEGLNAEFYFPGLISQ